MSLNVQLSRRITLDGLDPVNATRNLIKFINLGVGEDRNVALGYKSQVKFDKKNLIGYNIGIGYECLYYNSNSQYNVGIGYECLRGGESADGGTVDTNLFTGSHSNVAIGYQCGQFIGSGAENNVLIGYKCGHSTISNKFTGDNNTYVGYQCGLVNIGGSENVGMGVDCLKSNTSGGQNVAIGKESLKSLVGGDANVAIGYKSLENVANNNLNVAIGDFCGQNFNNTTAPSGHTFNVFIGHQCGQSLNSSNTLNTGILNTYVGAQCGHHNTSGSYNVGMGTQCYGVNEMSGSNNVAVGTQSLYNNISGNDNVSIGFQSLHTNTTGYSNVVIGKDASSSSISSFSNVIIGLNAFQNTTQGNENVSIGVSTGQFFQSKNNLGTFNSLNVFIGQKCGQGISQSIPNSGIFNTFIGTQCGMENSSGDKNTCVGFQVMHFARAGGLANGTKIGNSGDENTAMGSSCLHKNMDGNQNVAIGSESLFNNLDGDSNVAMGYQSLYSNTTTDSNIAIGYQSLYSNTASNNTAIGYKCSYFNSSGQYNTAIGYKCLEGETDAYTGTNSNVAIGYQCGQFVGNDATNNVLIGYECAKAATGAGEFTGVNNTCIGYQCSYKNSSGDKNVAIGTQCLYHNTSGFSNVALGYQCLHNNTSSYNTAIGYQCSYLNSSGQYNTAIGYQCSYLNSSGQFNTAIGYQSCVYNSTGSNNTAIGYQSSVFSSTGSNNVSIGFECLRGGFFYTGTDANVAIGYQCGRFVGDGATNNVLIGYECAKAATGTGEFVGDNNTYIGYQCGLLNIGGSENVAIGTNCLDSNTTGNQNVAIGKQCLQANISGTSNVGMGYQSLYSNTASNNTAIGYKCSYFNSSGQYNTAIGYKCLEGETDAYTGTNSNVAIGYQCGLFVGDGATNNVLIGYECAKAATGSGEFEGGENVIIGNQCANLITTGNNNVIIGNKCLNGTIRAPDNQGTLTNSFTGISNVVIGEGAGKSLSSGFSNTLIGKFSGINITNSNRNVCIGYNAGNCMRSTTNTYSGSNGKDDEFSIFIGYDAGMCLGVDSTGNPINIAYPNPPSGSWSDTQIANIRMREAGAVVIGGFRNFSISSGSETSGADFEGWGNWYNQLIWSNCIGAFGNKFAAHWSPAQQSSINLGYNVGNLSGSINEGKNSYMQDSTIPQSWATWQSSKKNRYWNYGYFDKNVVCKRLHLNNSPEEGGANNYYIQIATSTGDGMNVGDLVFSKDQGMDTDAGRAFISATDTTIDDIDFTGQHRSVTKNNNLFNSQYIGYIVKSIGEYKDLNSLHKNNIKNIKINSSLPYVDLTDIDNDKKCFGVITNSFDENNSLDSRKYKHGSFVNTYHKNNDDNRIIINSLGEGAIWVCNKNGNLENGDYITTCSIPGIGMKQDDDLLHNYTVAKITCDCNFNNLNLEVLQKLSKTTVKDFRNVVNNYVRENKIKKIIYDSVNNKYIEKDEIETIELSEEVHDYIDLYDENGNIIKTSTGNKKYEKIKTEEYDKIITSIGSDNLPIYEDDLDADGNQQMVYPLDTRFLQADGTQITETEYNTKLAAEEEVYIACFVGCTYHCG